MIAEDYLAGAMDGAVPIDEICTQLASENIALAAELQALKAQMAGQPPTGWQARFTSSEDKWDAWQPCSKEHFELVKSCPAEWPGYEVREVFAAPPAAQDVSGQWVPVSERIPADKRDVMLYCEDSKEHMVGFHKGHGLFQFAQSSYGECIVCRPSHWRYIEESDAPAHRQAQQQEAGSHDT